MKLRNPGYLISCLVLALTAVGCAGKNKPNASPDASKLEAQAKAAAKTEYLNKLRAAGCEGPKVKLSAGPMRDRKNRLLEQYGFFIAPDGYKEEKDIFDRCASIAALDKFFEVFWSIRDPDPSTPANEYKTIIDERILDVENEILMRDLDIPGTLFRSNGGLKGDMAKVYILRGAPSPNYKLRIQNQSRLADLMAWVYFDFNQKPVYVFLFVDKGSGYKLFRHHAVMNTEESFLETLREIAKFFPTSVQDYEELYRELVRNDPEYIFRFAISQFSYYSEVRLDKVIAPPTPEAITAKALQPRILGIPVIPKDLKMFENAYFAKVPGTFRMDKDSAGNFNPVIEIPFTDVDWEEKDAKTLEAGFDVRVTVVNEKTREMREFVTGINAKIPVSFLKKSDKLEINLNVFKNHVSEEGAPANLPQLLASLDPGDYEIWVRLFHHRTFKSNTWFASFSK